jgi:electron transfer flavoprotein beta subunit
MDAIVCIKQIIDPEAPSDSFHLDPDSKRQVRGALPLVISAYDQNALEIALKLRGKVGGKITALTIGDNEAEAALRSAMAMGVDAGVLVRDAALAGSDCFAIAHVLAAAIRKIGIPGLVLTGCVSGDKGDKVMAPLVAEELSLPCLNFVSRVEAQGSMICARRILEDGYEIVDAPVPSVLGIISDETNTPRYAKAKDAMAAARKPVPVFTLADLGVDSAKVGPAACRVSIADVGIPQRESRCELAAGETPEEQAAWLASRLRELKAI